MNKNKIIEALKKVDAQISQSTDKKLLASVHPYAIEDAIEYLESKWFIV